MVRLRLKRMGRKHKPSYRVTAVDIHRSRDGKVLEELGYYDPANKNASMQCKLELDRVDHWLNLGAQPTETVAHLIKKCRSTATA